MLAVAEWLAKLGGRHNHLRRRPLGSSWLWAMAALALCLAAGACATTSLDERVAVPEPLVTAARVPGYTHIRYWGDDAASIDTQVIELRLHQLAEAAKTDPRASARSLHYLTVSGGGSDGAFGAGIIVGWTKHGDRPEFDLVTGISTGSLIAPFAFLGPAYDGQLKEAFTEISGKDVYKTEGILVALDTGAIASNAPLRHLVGKYVNDQMVADLARQYGRGRRLLIGTTNLDAERPVIWDITAIAASGEPDRKKLIQDVLVASTSIPGIFPPIEIKVTADSKNYDEIHVDGGTSNQVFLAPASISARTIDKRFGGKRKRTLYIIRNGKTAPTWSDVKPTLAAIAGKSISSLIKTQAIGDLYRLYVTAKRDGVDYNLVMVPNSFDMKEPQPFDPKFMNVLFQVGYQMAEKGVPWLKYPPGYSP